MRAWIIAMALVAAGCAQDRPGPVESKAEPTAGGNAGGRLVPWEERFVPKEYVRYLVQSARGGNGQAALCLALVYEKGMYGVERSYSEAVKWRNAAKVLGQTGQERVECPWPYAPRPPPGAQT